MFAKPLFAVTIGAAASLGFAAPALAGDCPQGQEMANPLANATTMPTGVTDTVIGAIDLGQEIMVNGRFVDPMRIKLPRGRELTGQMLAGFEQERERLDGIMSRKPARMASTR